MNRDRNTRPSAFSRLELLALVGAVLLLAAAVLPAIAGNRIRSDRVLCANNLRQIGKALELWGNDHGDQPPWEILPADGGTYQHPLALNVWYHLAWMSNELVTPKILLCPTDTGQPARDFTGDPTGGYVHPNFANRATSYFLNHPFSFLPNEMLAGDRNITSLFISSCPRFGSALQNYGYPSTALRWTTALHNNAGNLLVCDGRVEQFATPQLPRGVASAESGALHFITPR